MSDKENHQMRLNLAVEYATALAMNLNALAGAVKDTAETLELISGLIREVGGKDDSTALTPD